MAEVVNDPAAEFLAREQSALGDLEEDFAFPDQSADLAGSAAQPADVANELNNESTTPNNDLVDGLNSNQMTNGIVNGLSQLDVNGTYDSTTNNSNSGPSSVPIIPVEEPESIKKWREEHKKAIEQKDIAEAEAIETLRELGNKELKDWYDRYAEQLEKTKQQNRNAEKEWIAERDGNSSGENGGHEWERITKLCDFNPKTSHNTKDTARMRSILLQVKQSPPPMPTSQ